MIFTRCCFLMLASVIIIEITIFNVKDTSYSDKNMLDVTFKDEVEKNDNEVVLFNVENDNFVTNDDDDNNDDDMSIDADNSSANDTTLSDKVKSFNTSKMHHIDIVVALNGELGNHIYKLTMGKAIQYVAEEYNYPFNFTFHYLGQGIGKSRTPRIEMTKCFPSYFNADFTECNVPSYKSILQQQKSLYGDNYDYLSASGKKFKHDREGIQEMLNFTYQSTKNDKTIPFHQLQTILDNNNVLPLSIPFVLADSFCYLDLIEKYYKQFQTFFQMDSSNKFCCKEKPDIDETVVHIRGFVVEMPRVGKQPKFTELDPEKTANVLLSHLQPGDKVVLLGRFQSALEPYKEALEKRSISVRTITGQSGVQDFCFLMSTTKEIVGMISSTYAFWASLLSTSVKKVILYRTSTFRNMENAWMPKTPMFNDRVLKSTFNFPVIDA